MARHDLTGLRFGRLVVVRTAENMGRLTAWTCLCDCGNFHKVRSGHLKCGAITSCGCLNNEARIARVTKHGECDTPEYKSWLGVVYRGRSRNPRSAKNYTSRGITVCARWLLYENFLADMGRRPDAGMSIDRIDNDKGYSPDNCRWATVEVQARNKRTNRVVETPAGPMLMCEAAEKFGIKYKTLSTRLAAGMPMAKAFTPGVIPQDRSGGKWC